MTVAAFGEDLTNQVVASFANAEDPRLRQIMQSLVRHLHAFALDVGLTTEEWAAGIEFLTRTGQMCDGKRQEFILLSDTLGLSMLVDAINHRSVAGATETTVLGPFYVAPVQQLPADGDIAGGAAGTPLYVSCRVVGRDGAPLVDAWVDVWQADDNGYYDVQKPGQQENLRARFHTDGEGRFSFWTIVPTSYPIPTDGPVGKMLQAVGRHPYRPAHIHFMAGKEGYDTLVTHLFIAGDEYLDSDAVFGVKPQLVVNLTDSEGGWIGSGEHVGMHKRLNHTFGLRPKVVAS
ncbi:MAG: intradiol ring-cleavage dioxygenase [Devosia sp.]|nr:intradiol ring-cleavage dioxygenase [Devosia sp.]